MSKEERRPTGDDSLVLRQRLAAELSKAVISAEKGRGRAVDRAELARRLNVSASSLYAYLNGTTLPGSDVFDGLLAALGVTGAAAGRLGTLRDAAEMARRLRPPAARATTDAHRRVPQQLPPGTPGFVGRETELARLDGLLGMGAALAAGPVMIATVEGTAGVGKTALALYWAHRVRDRFPDGQLHVNLRGFGAEEPMDPSEALHGFLQSLGVAPAAVPVHRAAASALLRTLLADRRLLLVLDNARSAEQVRPLLASGSGSLTVVTSRTRLDGLVVREGALRITLDVLPRYDAHALLVRRIGAERVHREPLATEELVDLCARLPLALSVAAARVAVCPGEAFGHLVAELREAHARLDVLGLQDADVDLRTVFERSYALLPPPAARLFRLLGCHPGRDVDGPACAALLGTPAVPRALLDTLTAAHLVQQHAPGRYALHDLLRLYAKERAEAWPGDERRAATGRLLCHYLAAARCADQHLEPWRPGSAAPAPGTPTALEDRREAMDWFERELATLQAVIAQAAASDGLEPYAWRLAGALAVYLRRSGRRHQRAAVHALARTAADRAGNQQAWATATRRLADALSRLHRSEEALELLRTALRTCRALEDCEGMRAVRLSLVRVHAARGDHRRALPHARLALAMAQRTGDPWALADGLTSVAQQQEELGRHTVALDHGRRALELYSRLGHLDGRAGILLCVGEAELGLGRPADAVGHYEASLALDRALGDRYREAHALDHLADAHMALGDHHQARRFREEALTVFEGLHHPDTRAVRAKLIPHGGPGAPGPAVRPSAVPGGSPAGGDGPDLRRPASAARSRSRPSSP
ncbi:helix-turn-helix transcriptional regulator [Streptomyces sp. RKAG293]|uniref:ATP-binding protein n=1 Tax=Streptomyces sp. RKAG293 TaxID=2893403 RepID=UPI0020335EA4|nr:helix-turn-helix transcriptional regulator [Streptomyces sp. RKAG293]MCM2422182.1 helix-turn-helix transcriptional regulator [Streptomyces sp. RKAG293]